MEYLLLWIETLTVMLLLEAILLAWIARFRWRWAPWVLLPPVMLLPLLAIGGLTAGVGFFKFDVNIEMGMFDPLLELTVGLLIGEFWIQRRAFRRMGDEGEPEGVRWPIGRLAFALLIGVALLLLTFSNIDAAIRQRLASVRSEAAALALSVAPANVADRDNAALLYQQVFDAMEGEKPSNPVWREAQEAIGSTPKTPFDFKDPRLAEYLKQREPELALLRQAASKPGCYFEHDYGRPRIDMLIPEMGLLRGAARLLAVDARQKAAVHDLQATVGDLNALFAIPEHAASEPLLISSLVAIAIDGMAGHTLEAILTTAPAPFADQIALAVKIDPNVSFRRIMERAMRMEESFGLLVYCDLGDGPDGFNDFAPFTGQPTPNMTCFAPFYRVFLLGDDMTSYRRLLRREREMLARPYYQSKDGLKDLDRGISRNLQGVLARLLLPALEHSFKASARGDAQREVTRLGQAMYRYHSKEEKFPRKLDDLAPESIAIVPRDPFDRKPFKLRRTDHGWVVYSIGPDLVDDHGRRIDRTSAGDIVFESSVTP